MNTKKIWLMAFVCGLVATALLFVIIKGVPTEGAKQTSSPSNEEEKKEDTEEEGVVVETEIESVEEVFENELLPFTEGKRAMTIAVADFQGVAGFIKAGSNVDVIAVIPVDGEKPTEVASLVLQNVKVLTVGHAADDQETMKRYQMVTVEVTPKQALTLSVSAQYELYLLLREEGDTSLEKGQISFSKEELIREEIK